MRPTLALTLAPTLALPLALALALGAGSAAAQAPDPAKSDPSKSEAAKPASPPPQAAAGGTPEKIPFGQSYGMPIGLDQARTVLAAAEGEAKRRNWPMNIAVVDSHGDLVGFLRMDGAQLVSIGIAQRKARTAARWRRETRVFYNAYAAGVTYVGTLDDEVTASPGGIPLVSEGRIVGAIGCSGGTGDQDAVICQAGVDALR